jgi:hypothetical protein
MKIQARRIKGDIFTEKDDIEINFTGNSKELISMTYTIEVVSGRNVTHGGGGLANEYLHYKSIERDADEDGDIDYTNSIMVVTQESKGESVIIVRGQYLTKLRLTEWDEEHKVYEEKLAALSDLSEIEALKLLEPELITEHLETGAITLSWSDLDAYV